MSQRERESGVSLVLATLVVAALGAMAFADGGPAAAPAKAATTQPAKGDPKHPRVALDTSMGVIVIELDAEKAPITVENFLKYVDDKHYDNTVFHRVIEGFMVQGGGMAADGKEKSTRSPIKNEWNNGLKNSRGTIAMARTGAPDSATAQFFINLVDNDRLSQPISGGAGYTVFGKVVEGMDVVDKIAKVKKKMNEMGEPAAPVEPVVLKKAQRQ